MSIIKCRKSTSALNTELEAVESVLACLNSDDIRTRLIIKSTSRDASVDVRAIGRTISEAYEVLLPDSVKSIAPLTSSIENQEVQGTAASRSPSPALSHSRPTTGRSSCHIRSTSKDASVDVRASGETIREAYKAFLPFIEPSSPVIETQTQLEVHSTTTLRSLSQGLYLGRPTTGRVRPIASSSRRGALQCAPSELVSQCRNQGQAVPRPFVPITRHPQRVENMPMRPHAEGPRVAIPLPETDNAEMAREIHPPSVKPSSASKSLIPRYNPKNKVIATKIQPVSSNYAATVRPRYNPKNKLVTTNAKPVTSNYAATVRPPSQKGPQPFVKAGRLVTKGSRSRGASSKEVELQKVSSQALGRRVVASRGRPVPNGPKALVKAPSMRPNTCGVKRPVIRKPAPEDIALPPRHAVPVCQAAVPLASSPVGAPRPSRHESTARGQPPASSYTGCRIRRSPFRPQRHGQDSRMKTPPKVFLTSTPRRSFSSPLSPPHIYADVIARTHTPNNPAARITCFQGCGMRGVLERLDIGLEHSATIRDSCTRILPTLRGSLSLPMSYPRIHGEIIAHAHSSNSPTARIAGFQGRGLRREWSDIELDHSTMMEHSRDPEFLTSTPQGSFSLPSPSRIHRAVEVLVHTHAQDSPTSMAYITCFLGCGLRAIINMDVPYAPGQEILHGDEDACKSP